MFAPSETSGPRTAATRSNAPSTRWDYVKTFYYDPVKWDFIKSVGFFGVAIYFIRDLASNDLLPME